LKRVSEPTQYIHLFYSVPKIHSETVTFFWKQMEIFRRYMITDQ